MKDLVQKTYDSICDRKAEEARCLVDMFYNHMDNNFELTPIEWVVCLELFYYFGTMKDGGWNIQEKIGPYRVDFLITNTASNIPIVIECDGHDFHEKTKPQAAHDKKRDRYLTAHGYRILRFTGSEIYNNIDECMSEIDDLRCSPN